MKILRHLLPALLFLLCACQHEYKRPSNYQDPQILIETDMGNMTVELYEDKAPNTVSHFIFLAEQGYYKDMVFHSVVKGLAVKGGCPNTKIGARGQFGYGRPPYFLVDEFHPQLRNNKRGILSMVNLGYRNTNGSQFMVLFDKAPFLDDHATVFGRVIDGLEVLDYIEKTGQKREGLALKREITFSIKVIRKNDHNYKFTKIKK
ncbi:MAG: peptidylprolyl isomerase [Lentisphaeraceae bacterium]|nr:peptidylprolyl isomerase [Lentisphaeraceae bacterium]